NNPIEIEFAANLETPPGAPKIFNFLQIRPIVYSDETLDVNLEGIKPESTIIYAESALGNGLFKGIRDLVYVKPDSFNSARNKDIAKNLEQLNGEFSRTGTGYILVGPGRWGSTDPWLGIPVRWPQISAARIIVESGLKNYRIDPSQGTHFFQNLISFRVAYFTINPYINEGHYDVDFLNNCPSAYEDEFIRHIRFDTPLEIMVDGKRHKGVIIKPDVILKGTG
ncbi:MAG: phosphoenolpyruvate synthase, partial [Bacteroidales bacterium]